MSADDFDPDEWKRWSAPAKQKALDRIKDIESSDWKPFYCPREGCDGNNHMNVATPVCEAERVHKWSQNPSLGTWSCEVCGIGGTPQDAWTFPHARVDQHPPRGDWLTWLIRGGRGSGKTRSGTEWTNRRTKVSPRIALIAPTASAARDTLVEGESGILAKSKPGEVPTWEPSKRKLTWPNGAVAHTFSGEEPDRLRGPQHFDAWLDEPAHMPLIEDVWSNLLFGMRLGRKPRICCTTTPLPTKWMKDLVKEPSTINVAVSTYANLGNLADHFASVILGRYEGTRRGRQEIHGEILEDVEGALWNYDMIQYIEPEQAPTEFERMCVAIDPAGSANKRSDETGIVVVGLLDGYYYVLRDKSGKYSPNVWAERSMQAYEEFSADALVPEKNYGGDMVRTTLENVDSFPSIEPVNSRRGKVIRADPIVALYEKQKVIHVGKHEELEAQMTSWVLGTDSPDRVDALVHGITWLAKGFEPSVVADPRTLRNLATVTPFNPLRRRAS